ncbi:type II toxin-antitoxin system antitoxin, RelB/DinJ family [Massilia violaceinigra]|uniref:Type II toxin-antitoxin system antitoxin, RelB/DinJ family n=1 Tax=Massilia violaceinigra TaxID=2045208 RepID=A0A2D2DUL7_9BURK|nr:type II toxin-antitoxin system RelB/DinJ family antitoxin [Massilia violaceinigra]ATQ78674.1 type II toxin-antitoxin system antitoxin, RelB/DinJ family [Massilia violaceinigra]
MTASTTTTIRVRVDQTTKAQAIETLAAMGLTLPDAVRMFLSHVIDDKTLPFGSRTPNAATLAAMAEAEEIIKSNRARFATADELFDDLEKASGK